MSNHNRHNASADTVNLDESISFLTAGTDVAFMAKSIYSIGCTYDSSVEAMDTEADLPDTVAGVNVIHSALIPPEWRKDFKEAAISRYRMSTKQPPQIGGFIILHIGLEKLCTIFSFGITQHLRVHTVLGTTFIDRIIWRILPRERKKISFQPTSSNTIQPETASKRHLYSQHPQESLDN